MTSYEDKISLETDKLTMTYEWDGAGNLIYIGESYGALKSEAKWRIKNLIWDGEGNLIDVQWARTDGKILFNKVWNNRTSYSYS